MSMLSEIGFNYKKLIMPILVICAGLLAGLSGWYIYNRYRVSYEQESYKDYAQAVDAYNKTITLNNSSKKQQELTDIEKAFATGAERHKSSVLAPFFSVYQANTQAELGNIKQAVTTLENALVKVDHTSPLFFLYSLKLANLKLDSQDKELQDQALKMLEFYSLDSNNILKDVYIYTAARAYYNLGDNKKADELVNKLLGNAGSDLMEKAELLAAKLALAK